MAAMHATHEAHVRAALERLKLLGASDRQIAALKQAEQIDPNFTVPAPISGVVLSRNTNLGLVVSPAQELFTVADLATVWVMASLSEKDFAAVHVGSTASVTAPACPGRVWKRRVAYIQPQVDPTTRTAQARIEVSFTVLDRQENDLSVANRPHSGPGHDRTYAPSDVKSEVLCCARFASALRQMAITRFWRD